MSLRTFRDFGGGSLYNDAFGFLDQNPHNTMHIWTGGMNPDYQAPPAPSTGLLATLAWPQASIRVQDLASSNPDVALSTIHSLYARSAAGEDVEAVKFVAGVRAWF